MSDREGTEYTSRRGRGVCRGQGIGKDFPPAAERRVRGGCPYQLLPETAVFKQHAPPPPLPTPLCTHCGQIGHGSSRDERSDNCPAYGQTCTKCGKQGHLGTVYRKKSTAVTHHVQRRPRRSPQMETATTLFQSLCSVENAPPVDNEIVCNLGDFELEHCVYNATQDTWVKKPSAPQLTLSLYTTHYLCDTRALVLRTPPLAGTNLLSKLGLTERYLSKTRMQMSAANGNNLDIIGAIALRLSDSASPSGTETRQIVCICRDTSDFFLSRGACVALGIVPRNFPGVGQSQQPLAEVSTCNAASESSMTAACECPRRQPPPLPPQGLPYPAIEDNSSKLEQWLLSHYKANKFNTCHHQPLRPMEGPPLRLMVDPDAMPLASHTPIDVPIHWRSDVKAGLDQDCSMGVIEEVPTGTPVTWYHRTVIGAKKNGKPRRISRPSTLVPPWRPTTPRDPFTKRDRCLMVQRQLCVTPGTATTLSHSTPTTGNSRRS